VLDGAESIAGIRRQVDAIVTHMLELGRKSQEIGGILEIITELADQTNILAVNAAIEAAGAGDAGRRFGVVAEEIRRLADRVSGSTKEIRGLILDVRAAVNASVMATETASKTVESGTTHFSNVSSSFRDITVLVRTTNEAAREIELSTKQQSSAVEQVNRGVADVAQAAKETEVTSAQMLETVSQLAALSRDLSRLVRAERAA
jgi:methyl-accepting chemotaxis protein